MKIDLFTFIAQIVNFLILVFLLHHLLYKPIAKAMDRREQGIKDRIEKADRREREARQQEEEYRGKRDEIASTRKEIMKRAEKEAGERKEKLLDQAQEEVNTRRRKWEVALRTEKEKFLSRLRKSTGQQIVRTVEKILRDLADEALEKQIIRYFIHRIKELEPDRKEELRVMSGGDYPTAVIVTAFSLQENNRDLISEAVIDLLGDSTPPEFSRDADLICGIKLKIGNREISWNISSYLSELGERLADEFEKNLDGDTGKSSGKEIGGKNE